MRNSKFEISYQKLIEILNILDFSILKIALVLKTTPDYFLLGILKPVPSEQDYSLVQKLMFCDEKKKLFISNFIDWFLNEDF